MKTITCSTSGTTLVRTSGLCAIQQYAWHQPVNFWILLTFGYQFAPRNCNLHKILDKLVGPDIRAIMVIC
jgi:hypothetical protein